MSVQARGPARRVAPSPPGELLLGHARPLQRAGQLAYNLANWRQFGDVVRLRLGPFVVHMVAHPTQIEHVLITHRQNYGRGRGYAVLRLLTGQGLLTSEGPLWQRQRRLMQPPFTPKAVPQYASALISATQAMLERWERGDRERDVQAEMLTLALDVIGRTMVSHALDGQSQELVAAFAEAVAIVGARITTAVDLPLALPTPANRRLRQALRTLDRRMYALIAERRAQGDDGAERGDLLSRLLAARDPQTGAVMSPRQVRDEVVTIFFAGHETIAQTLTWTWYLLAQHPEVEEQLHAELAQVLAGRDPSVADLPQLRYTRMVLAETLRLYPAVWAIPRGAVAADEIGGYAIPAGSMVFPFTYAAHRHPEVWPDPERFDPARFTPGVGDDRPPCSYLPFGAGPRACLGQTFAWQEALLVVALVAQRYRLRVAPGQLIVPHSAITLGPQGGMRMTLHRR